MPVFGLAVVEREILDLEDGVVAVDEVDPVRAVYQHHVARAVRLPTDLVLHLTQLQHVVPVHGDRLRTGKSVSELKGKTIGIQNREKGRG